MKAIQVRAAWLPDGEVAEIEKTSKGYDVVLPVSGITPRTAHALTAALGFITRKWWRWDLRNPKVASVVGTGVLVAFAGGWVLAPDEVRDRVRHMMPNSATPAEAAVAPEPFEIPADQAGMPAKWIPPVSTRRPTTKKTEAAKRKPVPTTPRPKPAAPVDTPESQAPVDQDPITPITPPATPPADEPTNAGDNGNHNGGDNGNSGRDSENTTNLVETQQTHRWQHDRHLRSQLPVVSYVITWA